MCHCNFSSARSDKVIWNAALASVTGEVKVIDRLVEEFELPSHGPCPVQWMLSVPTRKKRRVSTPRIHLSVCLPSLPCNYTVCKYDNTSSTSPTSLLLITHSQLELGFWISIILWTPVRVVLIFHCRNHGNSVWRAGLGKAGWCRDVISSSRRQISHNALTRRGTVRMWVWVWGDSCMIEHECVCVCVTRWVCLKVCVCVLLPVLGCCVYVHALYMCRP